MAVVSVSDPRTMNGSRDDEGHREFNVVHIVETNSILDGPFVVMGAAGLPAIGSQWNVGNDLDVWAFCYPNMKVTVYQEKEGDSTKFWRVEQKFSTKPLNRCQDTTIEDPLMELDKVSGSFVNYTKEVAFDRFGTFLKNSGWEQLRGPEVEFDAHRATVRIEQNVAILGLDIFTQMMNTVNDAPLWGLLARMIKLSNVTWERKYWGICNIYYTRSFDFDIDFNTFDRTVLDEGTMVLNGEWSDDAVTPHTWVLKNLPDGTAPDSDNPHHFVLFTDRAGNAIPIIYDSVLIGQPWDGNTSGTGADANTIDIEYYGQSNFLSLGIPTLL